MDWKVKGQGLRPPWTCPTCGALTSDFPALSRKDNRTEICSPCGVQEGLSEFIRDRASNARELAIVDDVIDLMRG